MKKKLKIMASASAVSVLAVSALAQNTPRVPTDHPDYNHEPSPSEQRAGQLNGAAKATDLIGMTVKNYQDEKLGKVDDLAVDLESGRVVQVILSTGGFIGIGDSLTAVPPGALHQDAAHKIVHLNADKEKLKGAPKFNNSNWDEGSQSDQVTAVYTYYGEQPYFVAKRDGYRTTSADVKLVQTLPRNLDGTVNTDGRTVEKVRNEEAVRKVAESHDTFSTRNPDGTWTREYYPSANGTNTAWSNLGYVHKASKLIGTPVKNLQDEKLGDVENLMVDLSAGRIVAVVVSSGGFLGIGDELSALPPTALRFNVDRNALQLDTTKEALSSAPHFKANHWPDFSQPSYASGVYRAYHVEPYFTTDNTTDADNTRRNFRDRDDKSLTPFDQGNSQADIALTAQIRKEIVANKSISVNAKNVKIITQEGQVTLRGPVNNSEEKRLIGQIASRIARSGNVDNQLEVQANTSSNN